MRSRCRHHLVNVCERTQQTSLLHIVPSPPKRAPEWVCVKRCYASTAQKTGGAKRRSRSLSRSSEARFSELGVQHVSDRVHAQLFPTSPLPAAKPDAALIQLSKEHLARHELLGKTSEQAAPIGFDLPDLLGTTLDEHFFKIGMASGEPYLDRARSHARASPPERPRRWARQSGWTKYHPDGSWEAVAAPDADSLTFDTEVMWKETSYPAMACAVGDKHWYSWLSPWLLNESSSDRHLIPLGDPTQHRIVVGHNIGYDRARVAEEYSLDQSKTFFIDTMSLHVAVNGMCSRQRPTWVKHRKARDMEDEIASTPDNADLSRMLQTPTGDFHEEPELWVGRSSVNSLRDVAKFHCGITIDKTRREWFGQLDRAGVCERLDELLDYCAADVDITHRVYKKVFPLFMETCPHPVSFAALRHLSSEILPVNRSWEEYIENAEATYHRLSSGVEERLVQLAQKALEKKENPELYQTDPWLSQLDWSGQEVKMVKGKKKGDPPRLAARQKKPGMPRWFKDLFATSDADIALTVRTRIAPLLLRLTWDGHPLVWSDKNGWCFKVTHSEGAAFKSQAMTVGDMSDEENLTLRDDHQHIYFKLPHKDGPSARCASPLAKGYLTFFENGRLGSEFEYAKEALDMNASCSYWISARDRIMNQMVVYESERAATKRGRKSKKDYELGYILPQVIPMGTITRRAVENTWLTASNAKKNRVGSELKSMIRAPPGYCFVGADVDSQELWIASLVGDASFKLHGGNAIGFMTLEGSKTAGTDLHSRTAQILGISRNDAKVFNYGRIYGAGLSFAQSLLRRFNPTLKEEDAKRIAEKLYLETKGKKEKRKVLRERGFWRGGTESLVFNKLEDFAEQERPRTPVLGAGITEALMRRYISKGGFMTSRINWAIQSSGVDYLHLLIVSMEYLCRRYNINARLALTVHDEIRYLAKESDKYRTAMALQVANVWTRAMFSQQMGIDDLPQSCAYFSAVDIDHVLRKEVDMDCVTPSHPDPIPPGESLDMTQLLDKGNVALLDPACKPSDPLDPHKHQHTYRQPVMEALESSTNPLYLRAQVAEDTKELNKIIKELKPAPVAVSKKSTSSTPSHSEKKQTTVAGRTQKVTSWQYAQEPSLLPVSTPWSSAPHGQFVPNGYYGGTGGERRRQQQQTQQPQHQQQKPAGGNTAIDVGLVRRIHHPFHVARSGVIARH